MNAYVVIEHAGKQDAQEVVDFPTRRQAHFYIADHYSLDEREQMPVDVMKRLPGTSRLAACTTAPG